MRPNFRRRKVCRFCVEGIEEIDYKDVRTLENNMTDQGKIVPSRITGTCSRHQRMLAKAIKQGRAMALVPFSVR